MNFEDLQSIWAHQPQAPASVPLLMEKPPVLISEFKRRGRMLGYEAFCIACGLIGTPLLSVINYLHRPDSGSLVYWTSGALHVVVLIAAAVWVIRRWQRHRALGRARISTLREQAEVSLANLEAECRDYRWSPWVLCTWGALAILSIAGNSAFHGGSWEAIALRVGITLGFLGMVGAVLGRHYRKNLLPACARQQEILKQMA